MLHVARQLLTGEISIEEAMEKCQVKDRRTIISWAKRAISIDQIENEQIIDLNQKINKDENIESSLEQEILRLELELANLKKSNLELLRFQNVLTNKINDLEILIGHAERSYKINIMKIKRNKPN